MYPGLERGGDERGLAYQLGTELSVERLELKLAPKYCVGVLLYLLLEMYMNELICPHCHGSVPRGAKVCRGCQAEVEYGAPPAAFLLLLIVTGFIGSQVSGLVPNAMSFLGWIVGGGLFIAGAVFLVKRFKERVNFKRVYKTK